MTKDCFFSVMSHESIWDYVNQNFQGFLTQIVVFKKVAVSIGYPNLSGGGGELEGRVLEVHGDQRVGFLIR